MASGSCTWLRDNWHTALSHAKLELDQFFLAGINHIFYHGTCYSPQDAPWPGWFFYAASKFDCRNSIWRDFPALSAAAARLERCAQEKEISIAVEPAGEPVHLAWPQAVEDRVHVHDLHATIMHLLGFDHERLTYRYAGRDFRLTDVGGDVVHDVLA